MFLGKIIVFCVGASLYDESAIAQIRMLQKAVSKKDPAAYEIWEKALMCAAGQKCDWTDKKYLQPIRDYLLKPHEKTL